MVMVIITKVNANVNANGIESFSQGPEDRNICSIRRRLHWDPEPISPFAVSNHRRTILPLPLGDGRGEGESQEREGPSKYHNGPKNISIAVGTNRNANGIESFSPGLPTQGGYPGKSSPNIPQP